MNMIVIELQPAYALLLSFAAIFVAGMLYSWGYHRGQHTPIDDEPKRKHRSRAEVIIDNLRATEDAWNAGWSFSMIIAGGVILSVCLAASLHYAATIQAPPEMVAGIVASAAGGSILWGIMGGRLHL